MQESRANITLNGKPYEAPAGSTIRQLLEILELTGQRVALLMDDEVVRKTDFDQVRIRENCQIEIVKMVGGG